MSGLRALTSKELRQLAPTALVLTLLCVTALVAGVVAAGPNGPSEAPAAALAAALIASALLMGATAGAGDGAPAFEIARPIEPALVVMSRLAVRLLVLAILGIVALALLGAASRLTDRVGLEGAPFAQAAWWTLATLMAAALASAFARRPSAAAVHGAWIAGLTFLVTTPERAIGSYSGRGACLALGLLALVSLIGRRRDEASTRRRLRTTAIVAAGLAALALAAFFAPIAARNSATRRDAIRAWKAFDIVAPAPVAAASRVSDEPLRRLHALAAPLGMRLMQSEPWPRRDESDEKARSAAFDQLSRSMSSLAGSADPALVEIPAGLTDWLARDDARLPELAAFLIDESRPILEAAAARRDAVMVPADDRTLRNELPWLQEPSSIWLPGIAWLERFLCIDALMASRAGDVQRATRDVEAANRLCREIGDGFDDPTSRIALVSCHRDVLAILRAMEATTPSMIDEAALSRVHERTMEGLAATGRGYGQSLVASLSVSDRGIVAGPSPWWSPLRELARRMEHRRSRSVEASYLVRELLEEPERVRRLAERSPCERAFLEMGEGRFFWRFQDGWELATAPKDACAELMPIHFMLRRAARLEIEAELTRVVMATRAAPPASSDEVPSKLCPGNSWRREPLADGSIRVSCWREYSPDVMVHWPSATVSLVHVVHPLARP